MPDLQPNGDSAKQARYAAPRPSARIKVSLPRALARPSRNGGRPIRPLRTILGSDSDLLTALDVLAVQHRELVATVSEHLAEVERRSLHLALGYSSLYVYARERLGLSEHEAYLRIQAARACRRHPGILEGLRSGELTLSAVKVVAPHLDAHPELIDEAKGQSKRQVERAIAEKTGAGSARTESFGPGANAK